MRWILNLGCENQNLATEGFGLVQLDIRSGTEANVVGDMFELPFTTRTFSRLFSSHTLEHVSHSEVQTVLKEINRVCEDGCEFAIFVPDFEAVVEKYISRKHIDQAGIFGNWYHSYDKHGVAFDRQSLAEHLELAGFDVREISNLDLPNGGPSLKAVGSVQEAQ